MNSRNNRRRSPRSRLALPTFILLVALAAMLGFVRPVAAEGDALAQLSAPAQEIVRAINQARAEAGLTALTVHPLLNQAAQAHADDILRNRNYSHRGTDGTYAYDRVARTGYSDDPWVSENWVASRSPQAAMSWWMNDYIHRVNILTARWREMGVGVASDGNQMIFVTVFAADGSGGGVSVAVSAPAATPPTAGSASSYRVQAGDTLVGIAARYGLSWQQLAAANGLREHSLLQIGQVLQIPGRGQAALPAAASTPPPAELLAGLDLENARPYTVRAGDTLFSIAARSGLTWQELAAANGLGEESILQIGQELRIPSRRARLQGEVSEASAPESASATASVQSATASATPGQPSLYTIQPGDTIISIALRHGLDWQALLALNGLNESSILQPGQQIRLR